MPPERGEIWMFDCGMVEKVRPVLILSIPFADTDRAVVTVIFHSTSLRGSQFEVKVKVPYLKDGAFIAQSVADVSDRPRITQAWNSRCRSVWACRVRRFQVARPDFVTSVLAS